MFISIHPLEHVAPTGHKRSSLISYSMLFIILWAAMHFQFSSATRVIHDQRQTSGQKLVSMFKAPFHQKTALQLHRQIPMVRTGSDASAMRTLVGSSPPKCIKKCGSCNPCKTVLVPIHTRNAPSSASEYYPVAWRCKCGGKLYNPYCC